MIDFGADCGDGDMWGDGDGNGRGCIPIGRGFGFLVGDGCGDGRSPFGKTYSRVRSNGNGNGVGRHGIMFFARAVVPDECALTNLLAFFGGRRD